MIRGVTGAVLLVIPTINWIAVMRSDSSVAYWTWGTITITVVIGLMLLERLPGLSKGD